MNWKELFDSIGLDGTKWQWRIMGWQRAWNDRRAGVRQARSQVTYRHKFCACGALLDREENLCPHCGKRAPSWRAQALQRAVGLVMPSALAVSSTLLVVNALMYMLVVARGGGAALIAPPLEVLVELGAMVMRAIPEGGYPLFITYGYLHFGIVHFGFNMLVLTQVGPMLEQEIGKARFFTLYTLALIGGGLARFWWSGPVNVVLVGASGALFGLIGFGLAYAHFLGTASARSLRDFFGRWAMYGFIFGFFIGADNVAHFGGFFVGLALGFLVERERVHREAMSRYWSYAAVTCLLATVASFIWVIMRFMQQTSHP